jgi:hypothetical protein
MSGARARIIGGAALATGLAASSYPLLFRRRCLTWGATPMRSPAGYQATSCSPTPTSSRLEL